MVPRTQAADAPPTTAQLIAALRSDKASFFEKARACQQLGEFGTRDAVPALAALLDDSRLSAYARSGLEGIPDASAAAALREAAGRLKGPLLVGVVNSLGVLRDAHAVELLGKLADDPGSGAAKEALLALGNISSPESIRLVEQALATRSDDRRDEAAAACLLAADRLRTAGNVAEAARLYESIRNAKVPVVYRAAATRGAILVRGADRVPFLIEQLRSGELPIRNVALLTIREVPDEALAEALNAELARAQPELQQQLLLALADCHNPQSIPAIAALASGSNPQLRQTALIVLGRIGSSAAPALLAALPKTQTPQARSVILTGLRTMEGSAVDDQLVQALHAAASPAVRIDLIRLLDSRGAAHASRELLSQAGGPDKGVSIVALSALQSLAGPADVSALITLIKAHGDQAFRDAAEKGLAGACSRSGAGTPGAQAVLAELKQATQPADRSCWIRVLAQAGYAPALPAIEAAATDPDETVAANALAQLGRWPDPAPIETLLQAAETAATPALRRRALGAVLDVAATAADDAQRPEATIVAWLQRANSAAQSLAEKRRILGILGRLKTIESFRLLASYLDTPDLRNEAGSGIVQIAPAIAKGADLDKVKAAVQKIAATVDNANLRDRARQVARTVPVREPGVSLFDGQSLAGWEGDANVWRVREGVIVGGSMNGNPRNEFLATTRSYANFVLRLEYKLVGTEGFINSGVQFRSQRLTDPPNEMKGYQADIGAGYSGSLYDESRRNSFLASANQDTIKRVEKPGDWNRYQLRCEGRHIQIWLNGEKTVDYEETDASIPQTGRIGLQIHGGNKAEVSFRNISIQAL